MISCFLLGVLCDPVTFKGHKVIRVVPETTEELNWLRSFLKDVTDIDVWKRPGKLGSAVDVRLPPLYYDDVISKFEEAGLRPEVLINDIQPLIDQQMAGNQRLKFRPKIAAFDYTKYHTLDEIHDWMENITKVYSTRASLFHVTNSYEGRPLTGIKIDTSPGEDKPGFWIEGGIHAREWISPATVIYMVGQMLDQFGLDPELSKVVNMFVWYILPVTNVDGYVYTWEKNRMWRKTRSKQAGNCTGVDPNRNWDMEWCKQGASKDPCSDTYCGPKAFSEVEVKGVADFILTIPRRKAFIDVHSYSQLWMSPWGFTEEFPPDFEAQNTGSIIAVEALEKVNGTKYENGPIATTIYVASGSSADWAYARAEIIYSYGIELRDKGQFGFLLPAVQIVPSGQETLQALLALARYVNAQPDD